MSRGLFAYRECARAGRQLPPQSGSGAVLRLALAPELFEVHHDEVPPARADGSGSSARQQPLGLRRSLGSSAP